MSLVGAPFLMLLLRRKQAFVQHHPKAYIQARFHWTCLIIGIYIDSSPPMVKNTLTIFSFKNWFSFDLMRFWQNATSVYADPQSAPTPRSTIKWSLCS